MLTPGKGLPLPRIEPATRPEPGLQAEHASHRAIGSPLLKICQILFIVRVIRHGQKVAWGAFQNDVTLGDFD